MINILHEILTRSARNSARLGQHLGCRPNLDRVTRWPLQAQHTHTCGTQPNDATGALVLTMLICVLSHSIWISWITDFLGLQRKRQLEKNHTILFCMQLARIYMIGRANHSS